MADVLTLIQSRQPKDKKRQTNLLIAFISVLCFALLAGAILASTNVKPFLPPQVASKHLQTWMQDLPVFSGPDGSRAQIYHKEEIRKLYKKNNYRLIWFDNFELKPAAHLLIQSLRETVADDRHLYSYQMPAMLAAVQNLTSMPKDVTALDILLSESFLTFSQDSQNNHFLPDLNSHDHAPEYKQEELAPEFRLSSADVLAQLMDNLPHQRLYSLIETFTPSHHGYLQLREQLVRYQEVVRAGQWRSMPDGDELTLSDVHQDIGILRNTLLLFGELETSSISRFFGAGMDEVNPELVFDANDPRFTFDEDLQQGLKRYQQNNGLEITGTLNQETRQQLQISPQRIARKIAFNMKRWRHLPAELGEKHVLVNMADYKLQLVENSEVRYQTKVIIGRPARRTPTLVDPMSNIVLNPTWTVPRRIAVNDILPKVKRDVDYLKRQNLQVFRNLSDGSEQIIDPYSVDWSKVSGKRMRYRFRQTAGPHNSLGTVKFNLPNDMAIYLHDTNHRELFAKDKRALSSGCVRVENPLQLAELLLEGKPGWTNKRLQQVVETRRTMYVPLPKPVPTYLLYRTAWVDEQGTLQMRPDVYNWDQLDQFGSDQNSGVLASSLIETLSP